MAPLGHRIMHLPKRAQQNDAAWLRDKYGGAAWTASQTAHLQIDFDETAVPTSNAGPPERVRWAFAADLALITWRMVTRRLTRLTGRGSCR